jgi:hypothetical protein
VRIVSPRGQVSSPFGQVFYAVWSGIFAAEKLVWHEYQKKTGLIKKGRSCAKGISWEKGRN